MKNKKWEYLFLIVLIVLILFDQSRYLFTYPVPDTGMWFGDESWTMLTLRAMARTGVACVPEALGSWLAHSNGLINGSVWLSALFYGLPDAAISTISPVAIGRIITLAISIITLLLIFRFSKLFPVPTSAILVALFAFVISNAFYFSSHSARLDAATGLAVLLYFYLLTLLFSRQQRGEQINRWAFFLPFSGALSLAVYVHVPALIALPMLYALWRYGMLQHPKSFFIALSGLIAGSILIVAAYWMTTGSFELLGIGHNQYYNVANSLPVLHLRSWRVQKINTIDRGVQVWEVAWPIVTILAVGIFVRFWKKIPYSELEQFFLIESGLLILGWGLFGGPAVFYNIHVLPVIALCAAVAIGPLFRIWNSVIAFGGFAIMAIVTILTIVKQERIGTVGTILTTENDRAIHSMIDSITNLRSNSPLILTDEPGENEIAGSTHVRLMTNHLLLFGGEDKSIPHILRTYRVDYLLLYSTSKWHSPFRPITDSLCTLVDKRMGTFTDQARSYDEPHWNELDTLWLYKVK